MKSILLISLIINVISPEAPRQLDQENPYKETPTTVNVLDSVLDVMNQESYQKARLQVAEACQELAFYLKKHPNQEVSQEMSGCNPDDMEWDALQTCSAWGVDVEDCDTTALLLLYAGAIKATVE